MRRIALAASALLALGLAAGCASTQLTSVWRDPGLAPQQFSKVVGIALSQDTTLRRVAEDEFVRAVGPAHAVAGYAVIPDDEVQDKERARARLLAAGFDAAVVFRLVGVDERKTWVPPTYYGGLYGYWGWAAPMVYEPGYLVTDRIVQVESNLYAVQGERLVWSAHSETIDPKNAEQLIDDVVKVVVAALRKEKLIP